MKTLKYLVPAAIAAIALFLSLRDTSSKLSLKETFRDVIAIKGEVGIEVASFEIKNEGGTDAVLRSMTWRVLGDIPADHLYGCKFGQAPDDPAGRIEGDRMEFVGVGTVVPAGEAVRLTLTCDTYRVDVTNPVYAFKLSDVTYMDIDELDDPEAERPMELAIPTRDAATASLLILDHGTLKLKGGPGLADGTIVASHEGFQVKRLRVGFDQCSCCAPAEHVRPREATIRLKYWNFERNVVTKTWFLPAGTGTAEFVLDDLVVEEGFVQQKRLEITTDDPLLSEKMKDGFDFTIRGIEAVGLVSGETLTAIDQE